MRAKVPSWRKGGAGCAKNGYRLALWHAYQLALWHTCITFAWIDT